MTFEEAKQSGKPFNRKIYKDGWYKIDRRGVTIHTQDLSERFWTKEDIEATDWVLQEIKMKDLKEEFEENRDFTQKEIKQGLDKRTSNKTIEELLKEKSFDASHTANCCSCEDLAEHIETLAVSLADAILICAQKLKEAETKARIDELNRAYENKYAIRIYYKSRIKELEKK